MKMIMKIVFDEDKVRRDGKYNIDKMYASIDRDFATFSIPKIGRGVYQSQGHRSDYSHFMSVCMAYRGIEWFMENVASWIWEDGEVISDVKKAAIHFTKLYYA